MQPGGAVGELLRTLLAACWALLQQGAGGGDVGGLPAHTLVGDQLVSRIVRAAPDHAPTQTEEQGRAAEGEPYQQKPQGKQQVPERRGVEATPGQRQDTSPHWMGRTNSGQRTEHEGADAGDHRYGQGEAVVGDAGEGVR